MKTLFAALALATLIAGPAFVTSADAARRSVPEYDQPRANHDSDGSWRCYPYCPGGTYEGRPVREWLKALPVEDRKIIGEDIKDVEFSWPIGMAL